jgi:hypothetical protein
MERVMSRGSKPAKVQQWTDRLKRYQKSDQTVADFCQKEGVSTPTFYQWKKRLASDGNVSKARPIAGNARRNGQPIQRQGESLPTGSGFRSVEFLPATSSMTTIRLPNGIEIELGGDLRVTDLLVKQLLERSADLEGGW